MLEQLSDTLTRLCDPIPRCARPGCGADLLDRARGSQYCAARCRMAAHRARRATARLEDQRYLLSVAEKLITQTTKRARGAVRLSAVEVAAALAGMPAPERAAAIETLGRSPETVGSEDAWHRRQLYGASVDYRASVDQLYGDADLRWCIRNEAAGVLVGSSLGYVRKSEHGR